MAEDVLSRHQMVHIDPGIWATLVPSPLTDGEAGPVGSWAANGWPLIARRPTHVDAPDLAPLGLPLPPMLGGRRIAVQMPHRAIRSITPPPLLRNAAASAPSGWRETIDALTAMHGQVRCFGSLAWQAITGLSYLTSSSDLDLLWRVASAEEADRLTLMIESIEVSAPMRIDGELLFAGDRAVQWREWRAGGDVLVKSAAGILVQPQTALLE